jgi:hypothetical protein
MTYASTWHRAIYERYAPTPEAPIRENYKTREALRDGTDIDADCLFFSRPAVEGLTFDFVAPGVHLFIFDNLNFSSNF